jgi:hypothetical protein
MAGNGAGDGNRKYRSGAKNLFESSGYSVHKRCVRLLCEKWHHASQRQPMRELLLLEWLLQALIQSQQPCFDVNGRTVDEYEPSLFTRAVSLEE